MKNSKGRLKILFVLTFVVFITSCKRDGCTDPNASNYRAAAREDDGSCEYIGCTNLDAENFNEYALEDNGECTFARDKFIGTYYVVDNCNSDTYEYSITIIPHEDFSKVILSNMGEFCLWLMCQQQFSGIYFR